MVVLFFFINVVNKINLHNFYDLYIIILQIANLPYFDDKMIPV